MMSVLKGVKKQRVPGSDKMGAQMVTVLGEIGAKWTKRQHSQERSRPREVQKHIISSVSCHEIIKEGFGQEYLLKESNRNWERTNMALEMDEE